MESGALAGVVAGLVVGVGSFLLLLGGGLILRQQLHAQGLHSAALRALYIDSLVRSGVGTGLAAVIGLALGALGGLAGRGPGGAWSSTVAPSTQPVGVPSEFAVPQAPRYLGGDAPTIQTPQPPQG